MDEIFSTVLDLERAADISAAWKLEGLTVVLTNGCFDILHAGHTRYLRQARLLGDRLIVALNSDESVQKLKGPDRPINSEDDRAEVLLALRSVDLVTIFSETTPHRVIEAIQPDVHTKGGDYREDQLPEADLVRALGGRVVILPLVTGRSTTAVLEKVRRET